MGLWSGLILINVPVDPIEPVEKITLPNGGLIRVFLYIPKQDMNMVSDKNEVFVRSQ